MAKYIKFTPSSAVCTYNFRTYHLCRNLSIYPWTVITYRFHLFPPPPLSTEITYRLFYRSVFIYISLFHAPFPHVYVKVDTGLPNSLYLRAMLLDFSKLLLKTFFGSNLLGPTSFFYQIQEDMNTGLYI
jgi:hypothetical protein